MFVLVPMTLGNSINLTFTPRLNNMRTLWCLILLFLSFGSYAQNCSIKGRVMDDDGAPVEAVSVVEKATGKRTSTNAKGEFTLEISCNGALVDLIHPAYTTRTIKVKKIEGTVTDLGTFRLGDYVLDEYVHEGNREGTTPLVPKIDLFHIPTPKNSVEDLIKTLPGVRSNNEMSSTYNVRGGNFEENLIYVNDIEIYRPFLVRAGQQEGLSFINPDMVQDIYFSSGGFEARYDDRLSSVLSVKYRRPTEFRGSVSGGIMGYAAELEGMSKNHRFTWMVASRYQANGYILRTLDTKGDYRPRFNDFQILLGYDITDKLNVSWLSYFARNNYRMVPQTRQTDFGTINQALRLTVYYEGQEVNLFQTLAQGLTFTYHPNRKTTIKWVNSWFRNDEQENYDVIGAYQLGDVERDPGKPNFGEVSFVRGTGGMIEHARNRLLSNIANTKFLFEKRYKNDSLKNATFNGGIKYQYQIFDDKLSEWNMLDSAGFSIPQKPSDQIVLNYVLKAKANLQSNLGAAFIQNTWNWQKKDKIVKDLEGEHIQKDTTCKGDTCFTSISSFRLVLGLRANYLDMNNEFNIGPRIALQYVPSWFHTTKKGLIKRRNIILRLAGGMYSQPPLYRELRALDGTVNTSVKAQQSIHGIVGADWFFTMWGRTFKYSVESYYKYLTNIVPYEVDNVRLRYYGNNLAKGYAVGVDMKINGEFIKGIESWATVSLLQTREDLNNDSYTENYNSYGEKIIPGYTLNDSIVSSKTFYPGYIPRPTDQTLSFSLFFQDEMPKLEQFKAHVNLLFASGVPFGPPDNIRYRDTLRGPLYRRVDIGFSYELFHNKKKYEDRPKSLGAKIDKAFITLEVFNLLGISNTISYNWIQDASGLKYAVPNYLTGRRFNLKLVVKF